MNLVLAGCLLVVVIFTAWTRVDYTRPNIEVLPDMKYTPARMAYSPSFVFANGRTLQAPVPGTIARGQLPRHFAPTQADALRAGEELENPYQAEPSDDPSTMQESIRRGGVTYRTFCISCHGATGTGDGPVTKRGFPPPPSLTTGKSLQMKDGQLFHILTYGQAAMPNFAAQISDEGRWDAINFLRSMQSSTAALVGETPSQDEDSGSHDSESQSDEAPTGGTQLGDHTPTP
jgi:mono/diheme cytochrome c family protein